MRFKEDLYLKWLDPTNPSLQGMEFKAVNQCVLAAYDSKKKIMGLTVFKPQSLDLLFIDRLKKRISKPEMSGAKFHIFYPDFVSVKADSLLSGIQGHELVKEPTSFISVTNRAGHFNLRSRLRVINVDDSSVILKLLQHGLKEFSYIDIIAQISNSTLASEEILRLRPDVITMDIQMPHKNGVQLLRELLEKEYFPTIMVSSLGRDDGQFVFDALNSGAFDYIQKPKVDEKKDFFHDLEKILLAAVDSPKRQTEKSWIKPVSKQSSAEVIYPSNLIWCLGSSTGGTQALTRIFTSLPKQIPPTFVVQHIPPVFSKSFADSLNNLCGFTVKEAENNEVALPNHVYIAPGGQQMAIKSINGQLRIVTNDDAPLNRFKPSVDYLFNSVAQLEGIKIVAGILTGMGKDGAQGLLKLKKAGATTIAQDEATCAVFGMPRAAIELNAVDHVLPLDSWSEKLLGLSRIYSKVS